eukprot:CAMPEP_0116092714 /NCGR_PEP_ID=MMETSP0327-20121206/8193_1 /TAXON_ID=44447 /ORGANISM="Pseudo-nitzschia delicatissima, Strain B596" /LENGTH=393 /DNA_ID=CAMNT_0003584165 /DNA_START=38 /DNA_END=1219 /DNA_ORIENTATION=-
MASITTSRRLLAPGITSLKAHLQSEINTLRQTPVLLIESENSNSSSKVKQVSDSCQWVKLTMSQQFSLRTVPTTISSAVPTQDALNETLELMQRTGASSVVSVGSGAAMDLGKAVQASLENSRQTPLLMVPTTYSGILAAGASHSLFLDNDEETLMPFPQSHRELVGYNGTTSTHATVSTLEPQKYMEPMDGKNFDEMLYAVSAILLDAGLRESTHSSFSILIQETLDLITLRKNGSNFDATLIPLLINLIYKSSGLLSYGLGNAFEEEDNRSIAIALTSSLIPTLFPETHPATFFASLVPGLVHACADTNNNNNTNTNNEQLTSLIDALNSPESNNMLPPPSLTPMDESLKGFSVPDMALSHIHSNQAVWKPLDVDDDIFVQVLQHCIQQQE